MAKVNRSYKPEDKGVFIAYTSIYGNTKKTVEKLKEVLHQKGEKEVVLHDLAREDMAEAVENAFRYDRMVLASPTYDGGLFPYMAIFIHHLKSKNYQNRTIGLIENGSWAPMAGKIMKEELSALKHITFADTLVTIKSSLKEVDMEQLNSLAENLTK